MKTDRFSDSIRRKLESIRPDFSEKDWQRMQATLQRATPLPSDAPPAPQPGAGSAWSAQPWLMAAAALSTVVLVSLAIYQRNQISDLRQTVRQLSRPRTTTQPRQATTPNAVALPSADQAARRGGPAAEPLNESDDRSAGPATGNRTDSRPDTVYITRYVTTPTQPTSSAPGRVAQRLADAPAGLRVDYSGPGRSLADAQPQQRRVTRLAATKQGDDVADNTLPIANGTTKATTKATVSRLESKNSPARRTDEKTAMRSKNTRESDVNVPGGRQQPPATEVAANPASGERPATAVPTGLADAGVPSETGQPVATNALTTRPVTMNSLNWSESLARQARRMRPVRTTTVGGQEAPVNQPASQPVRVTFGFRLGAGGELSRNVRSGSLLTELLIGKDLTLGVGLGMASFAGGTFLTPEKFDERKGREHKPGGFKREYVYSRRINPLSDITNIGMHTTRVQLPISLGYRIPVGQTLSLLPSVGTTLGMRSREFVTFTYREPFGTYEEAKLLPIFRATDLFNNLTFGANVEWQRSHWVWQAGPVLTVPTVADANWQQSASVGLRARVFYQF